jgi:chorismate-pyruvate lyase
MDDRKRHEAECVKGVSALASPRRTASLYPLSEFYLKAGLSVPTATAISPDELPEPYRRFLAHSEYMTPTLEGAFHQKLRLQVISHCLRDNLLLRQVLLTLDDPGVAVELGAIAIYLEEFPKRIQELIFAGTEPMGTILRLAGFDGTCNPLAYFALPADDFLLKLLPMTHPPGQLYGRRTVLKGSSGRPAADVVEILPALESLLSKR